MKFKSFIISILLFGSISCLYAQRDKQVLELIQDDIDVMETILNRLFAKENGQLLFIDSGIYGFYLDGYGILFKIPYSTHVLAHEFYIRKKKEEAFEKAFLKYKDIDIASYQKDEDDLEIKKKYDQEIQKIKDLSTRFLGDYVPAIHYLGSEHWITLIVDFNDAGIWYNPFMGDKSMHQLIVKVQMKNINAYHKGEINREKLKERIEYISQKDDYPDMDKDIEIFADIIQSYFHKGKDINIFDNVKGFYLNGYGVIYLLRANFQPNIINIISSDHGKGNFSIKAFSSFGDTVNIDEKLTMLENNIISLFSRFGHTLRKLDSKEWLEVAVNTDINRYKNNDSKIIIRAQKADINNLKSDKITMDEFKRRVKIIKY